MGIFGRLRGIAAAPGSIDLHLASDIFQPGEEVEFTFTVNATGQVKGKQVAVCLHAREEVRLSVTDEEGHTSTEQETTETYKDTLQLSGPLEMKAEESTSFEGRMRVPSNAQPTYEGQNANHRWYITAFADIPMGKDIAEEQEIFVR